jgi:hypothetical protein
VVKQLPEVARAVAEPFGRIDNMVVLDGPDGLSKGIIGAVTAVGSAVGQIRSLDGNGRREVPAVVGGGGDDEPESEPAAPRPRRRESGRAREGVAEAGERLASFLNEVADQDDRLETVMSRLDADDELREVARGLAEHPDRSRLLNELGLSDRGQVAGNMLLDVLSPRKD